MTPEIRILITGPDATPPITSLADAIAASGGVTMWDKAINQLVSIARLEADWDGDGAPAIRSEIVRSTSLLLRDLRAKGWPPPNDVYPTPDGNIIAEWQSPEDVITRIEVDGLGTGELMVSYPDAPSQFKRMTWPTATKRKPFRLVAGSLCISYRVSATTGESAPANGCGEDVEAGCCHFPLAA